MVKINMNQQRKLSRHNSRQSSIGETTSVGFTKSAKSSGSADYTTSSSQQSSANNNSSRKPNGLLSKHGSQDSQLGAIGGQGSATAIGQQPANILNVAEMLLHGVADKEILDIWLKSIQCEEFVSKFIDAGYDMPTLSRITPQDLTAIGVTEPTKRLKILTEIKKLNLQDGIPNFVPASLSHCLSLIRLDSYYYKSLCDQQVDTMDKLCQLTWEDFEELGITKLGHQKRFQLAIERVKELETAEAKSSTSKPISEPIYDTNPSQILLVASAENHSMNGPIINKQSSTSEISSTGSGSMHSVYSAASVHYQATYATSPDNQQQSVVFCQHTPNGTQAQLTHSQHQQQQQLHHHQQQQQAIYGQLPPPMIFQQPAAPPPPPLVKQQTPPLPPPQQMQQQSHYQPVNHEQPPQVQASQSHFGLPNNHHAVVMNSSNSPNDGSVGNELISGHQHQQPPQNRQSINSQLPFSALAKLPKHQQLLLQQSSIYATLSRQSFKVKQPPPPVPIRTNSLKSNSLVDDAADKQQQQSGCQSQLNNCHHTASTSSLYRSDTISSHEPGPTSRGGQFNSQTMLTKNKSFSGNAHMEAYRARFLNRISQQPPSLHNHNQQQHFSNIPQQFQQTSTNHNSNSNNNNGSNRASNQNFIYGTHSNATLGTRTLNGHPIEIDDLNLFRPPPNNYISNSISNINNNSSITNHHHHYNNHKQSQNSLPNPNNNQANSLHNEIHHNRDTTSLYHSDDFDLNSDTNSTKSLMMQSSSSLVASPVNNQHNTNQQALSSLSQGSGSSQTLYNSASSGSSSNDQSFNLAKPSDLQHRSAASSCTLNDANLTLSDVRHQLPLAGAGDTANGNGNNSSSITANSSAANLSSLGANVSRPTSIASVSGGSAAHCNATTGKDDDFPPPPSPLSLTDLEEQDLVSLNSDSNFTDISHGLMTFRVGI